MSQICIISFDLDEKKQGSLKARLSDHAKESGFGVYFGEPMPFSNGSTFHFDLSDDFDDPNCEKLLAFRNAETYDPEIRPQRERIRYICEAVSLCMDCTRELRLYTSEDSGALPEEYQIVLTDENSLPDALEKNYDQLGFVRTACFIVTR